MKILITAGPTWVKIDEVRILTNVFTGKSGIFLGNEFKKKGCLVTLIINSPYSDEIKRVKVIPFRYFDDFKNKVEEQLNKERYDAIIHTAAVSDYKLKNIFKGKIPSSRKELILKLVPTEKVIRIMRHLAKGSALIQFKLEAKREGLIEKAYQSLKVNQSDFVVANAMEDLNDRYKAFIIDKKGESIELNSKKELFNKLYNLIKASRKHKV